MLGLRYGHELIALGNLCPVLDSTDELDSYMYQTVGHQLVSAWAACTGLPLFRGRLHGSTKEQVSLRDHVTASSLALCKCPQVSFSMT